MTYAREIKAPKSAKEGLSNFIQLIINRIEAGNSHEALMLAVDLLDTISGDANPYTGLTDAPDMMPISEHFEALRAANQAEYRKGFEAGGRAKATEIRKLIGEAA